MSPYVGELTSLMVLKPRPDGGFVMDNVNPNGINFLKERNLSDSAHRSLLDINRSPWIHCLPQQGNRVLQSHRRSVTPTAIAGVTQRE